MTDSKQAGKVQTVLGPIDPNDLGITLTHEHLVLDLTCYFEPPEAANDRAWIDAPLTMDRLGGIGLRWSYNLDTMRLLDEAEVTEQVFRYRHAGGHSLVDTTSIGIGRDPLSLARMSRATGLNIIMGASHYVPVSHPADMDRRTEEAIADEIIRDVTVGVGDTGIRSGIIGEVGNMWPTSENERKVLRASVHAQKETGAPILIHPGFHPDSPPNIMETLVKAGADPQRVVMGHLDSFKDRGWLKSLAETGCFMEWDTFGMEDTSLGAVVDQNVDMPSDVQRMESMEYLVGEGYGNKLVMAHDVCFRFRYSAYGGKTYDHILDNIVPRMRTRGVSEDQINKILVENPRTILTFV